jgi:two-component sensor histidine kinase
MKNLLTVLRSVASQTQTEGRTAEQYRDVLLGRFEAVINAQLISANGEDADLSALIAQILQPVAGSRANVAPGPPVVLPQHQVLPVLMMLHELATNALKYGALSNASGVVHIGWNTADHDGQTHVLLDWREEGGPPVSPPDHQGFGTNLIQHGVNAEGGEVAFDFPPTGLCARITLPLAP